MLQSVNTKLYSQLLFLREMSYKIELKFFFLKFNSLKKRQCALIDHMHTLPCTQMEIRQFGQTTVPYFTLTRTEKSFVFIALSSVQIHFFSCLSVWLSLPKLPCRLSSMTQQACSSWWSSGLFSFSNFVFFSNLSSKLHSRTRIKLWFENSFFNC